MALTFPIKIEFKDYPSGSWQEWSQYLSRPPRIKTRVESKNEGEAGVIVFDSAAVTFRYESGNPVYTAFSGDLTSVQRYLFRLSFPKTDKSYIQRFEGMADFSTIKWNEHNNLISFSIADKLSALGILSSEVSRAESTLNARVLAQHPTATHLRAFFWPNPYVFPSICTEMWLRAHDGTNPLYFTERIIFPGELIRDPQTWDDPDPVWLVVLESKIEFDDFGSNFWNKLITTPFIAEHDSFPQFSSYPLSNNDCTYLSKELYGIDINNVSGNNLTSLDGIKIIEALYNQAWAGATLLKKPPSLVFNIPSSYALRLTDENPFGGTPLDALKTLADSMKCYLYVNREGNLVIQDKGALLTSGTTRFLGSTKVILKKKRYFWDKLVDGATVKVKSWIQDESGEYLQGVSTQTLQTPGATGFIKPKNEATKEILTNDPNDITIELLNSKAAQEASTILNFYGKRRAAYDLVLDLDDNTIGWELIDNLTIGTEQYFFTQLDFDGLSRTLTLEPVEVSGHDYDFRQIVVSLAETYTGSGFFSGSAAIGGSGSGITYVFNTPLLLNGSQVTLEKTGNFKITDNKLDTIQDILTTSTPTFNQINLTSPGTSTQAVRADRTVSAAAPLTGGGDLTANRTLGLNITDPFTVISNNLALNYNTTNLKLTTGALNTVQDIATISSPRFANIGLGADANTSIRVLASGSNDNAYVTGPIASFEGAYIVIGDHSSNRTFTNGLGIKFHDSTVAHASILYQGQKIHIGRSSGVSHLQIDAGYETITFDLTNKRMGISQTSPSVALEVAGDVHLSGGDRTIFNRSNNYLALGTNNAERIRITNIGDVGIGVTPNAKLEVGGNIFLSGTSGGGNGRAIYQFDNNALRFGTNNTERFRISADGNIGINITVPVEKLHLGGHFKQDGSYSIYNNFTSGWTGSGWRVDYNITSPSESTIEADNLFLRGTLSVYELLIQQIRATNGSVYISSSAKIKVVGVGDPFVVTVEDPSGQNIAPFLENDIVIVQRVNLNNTVIVKRLIREVTDVNGLNVTLSALTGAPADVGVFEPGDDLIRIGNTTNTARQGSIYLTSDDSNAPFIDVIDNVAAWADWRSPAKLKARLGKLTGITDAVFGSLSGYGLYSKRLYLSSGNTTGIALYADTDTAKLTMRQAGNVIFDFDTAAAAAKIASWNIDNNLLKNDTYKIYLGTGLSSYATTINSTVIGQYNSTTNLILMRGNPSTNYIASALKTDNGYPYFEVFGKTQGSNNVQAVLGDLRAISSTGFGLIMKEGTTEHFKFTEIRKHIANWDFTDTYLKSPEILIGGLINNHLKLNASSSLIGVHIYLDTEFVGTPGFISVGRILDTNGSITNNFGIAAFIQGQKYFYLSDTEKSIAGWNFDTAKFTKGGATVGFSLNTSSTPFITGASSKGFEVYDASSPKLFVGKKDGYFMDWNITATDELTIKGRLTASEFSTSQLLGGNPFSIVQTCAAIGGGGANPYIFLRKYNDSNDDTYTYINNGLPSMVATRHDGSSQVASSVIFDIDNFRLRVNINGYAATRWRGSVTSDPSTDLREGDLICRTDDSNRIKIYANGAWRNLN